MMNTALPTFFVPHGSPMFALEPGAAGQRLATITQDLQAPRAVVIISPHWETQVPTVGTADTFDTIHDFSGFDPRLYALQYPAIGAPTAANMVIDALTTAGFKVETNATRGLDHGAWVPLRHMFPEADIPIVPLSIQHQQGPQHAYRVGQALAPLRDQQFLIVGSGNITHNLSDWHTAITSGAPSPAYVQQFADWVAEKLSHGDIAALLNYRQFNPNGRRAHPRDEHLLPLFTALGAAGEHPVAQAFHRGISDVVLAMDGYRFH